MVVSNTKVYFTNVFDRDSSDDLYHVKFTPSPLSYRHSLKSEVERSAPDTESRTLGDWQLGRLGRDAANSCGNMWQQHFKAAT